MEGYKYRGKFRKGTAQEERDRRWRLGYFTQFVIRVDLEHLNEPMFKALEYTYEPVLMECIAAEIIRQ